MRQLSLSNVLIPIPEQAKSWARSFDDKVDTQFDKLRGRRTVDRTMYLASESADFGLIWLLCGGVQGLVSPHGIRTGVRVMATEGIQSVIVNAMIKPMFRRQRPLDDLPDDHEHPHKFRKPITSSFPSGHASASFCAAVLLSDQCKFGPFPSWPVWFAGATLVSSSRVHTKAHHASDVVGGAALGLLFGMIAKRVMPL